MGRQGALSERGIRKGGEREKEGVRRSSNASSG
jgi:hypothetical protein